MLRINRPAHAAPTPARTAAPTGAGRVLVIDDDPVLLNVVGRSLRAAGFQVLTAMSAEEGLDRFETLHPDCVIVDVYLPGLDGFAFVERAHAISPEVPLLMLSGLEGVEHELKAAVAGARRFLPKAIDVRDLARHIRDAIDSPIVDSSPADPSATDPSAVDSPSVDSPSVDPLSATLARTIPAAFTPAFTPQPPVPLPTLDLDTLEHTAISQALSQSKGNRTQAARLLGIHVRTLHRKLRARRAEG